MGIGGGRRGNEKILGSSASHSTGPETKGRAGWVFFLKILKISPIHYFFSPTVQHGDPVYTFFFLILSCSIISD